MGTLKRDARLVKLSWDHHRALVLARRLKNAGRSWNPAAGKRAWDEAAAGFAADLEPHFQIEEKFLLPALRSAGEGDLADATLSDHAALRGLISMTPGDLRSHMVRFGDALTAHVRFEERTLFETAQKTIGDDALDSIADACDMRQISGCAVPGIPGGTAAQRGKT